MTELEPLIAAYGELYLRLMRTLDSSMAEQGASFARHRLLLCLQKRGSMRATDIAEFFSLSPRTVTEAIDALEKEGLLERKADPTDRRAKLINITSKGKGAVERTEPVRQRILQQTFGVLDDAEQAQLLQLLTKVVAELPALPQGRST